MTLFDLTGKVAVITGATKGIGLGIAKQMAAHGAKLVISAREAALCESVAAELNDTYGGGKVIAKGQACDLMKLEDIARLQEFSRGAFGGVDIVVANASMLSTYHGPSEGIPPELFDTMLSTNVHHNFRLCSGFRGDLAKRGGGAMILIGSLAGHSASPNLLAYAVSKAGVSHVARCLADEMAADNIRVNCVAPGLIRSFSSQRLMENEKALARVSAGIPLKRPGEAEEVAGAVIFLASAAGAYVTGETILVDGGRANLSPPQV
ncbi:MAG: SDR family oxidoreductase [Caulobacterales bacterium]